jgi:hypothetical protein
MQPHLASHHAPALISTRHDGGRISLAEQERGFGGRRRAAAETEEKRGAVGEEGDVGVESGFYSDFRDWSRETEANAISFFFSSLFGLSFSFI